VEDLPQQLCELQEAVRRLQNIRESVKELAGSKCTLQWTHSPPNSQKLPHWHTQEEGGQQ